MFSFPGRKLSCFVLGETMNSPLFRAEKKGGILPFLASGDNVGGDCEFSTSFGP